MNKKKKKKSKHELISELLLKNSCTYMNSINILNIQSLIIQHYLPWNHAIIDISLLLQFISRNHGNVFSHKGLIL